MIYLSYKLSDELNAKAPIVDWASADATELRYYVFLGDQIFLVNDADFSARWGWIPILDFAASLVLVAKALELGETHLQFDFTDSDELIYFDRQGQNVL